MNQTKLLAVLFAFLLYTAGCKTAAVQSTAKPENTIEKKSEGAIRMETAPAAGVPPSNYDPAELIRQHEQNKPAGSSPPPPTEMVAPQIPADGNLNHPYPADQRIQLMQKRAEAIKNGLPTDEYDRQLKELEAPMPPEGPK